MKQVAPHTYVLGTRGHNFYMLRDGDEVSIIDAGCSGEWSKLESGLESIGLSMDAASGIVATHSHADHFGLAGKALENDIPVSVHEDEESRAIGTYDGRYAASAVDMPLFNWNAVKNFVPMLLAGVMSLDHVDAVETFTDGNASTSPGVRWWSTPRGHTEGHVMFHCPELGLLFTGDGLITMDLIGPGTGPQLIERRFNLDHEQARASLDRIVDLEASLLLPGYGAVWRGTPAAAVALVRS